MKIELRNVKHYASMSEETACFEAMIYLDGKPAGRVYNRGHGGCHDYDNRDTEKKLDEFAATLPVIETEMMDPHDRTKPFVFKQDADHLIDDALTELLVRRDFQRAIGKRVLFLRGGKLYQTKTLKPEQLKVLLADPALPVKYKAEKVLNLLPDAEAFALFRTVPA